MCISPSADRVKNVNVGRVDGGLQAFEPFYITAADENIDVLADFALFVEDAVAERDVLFPERIKHFGDGRIFTHNDDLGLAAGKCLEVAAKMNSNRHKE